MLTQQNLEDSPNAISSQGSADGHTQLGLLDGPMTDQCGQVHHHANHSQLQEASKEKTMNDTYGQFSSISSASASLQQSLESKLRAQLNTTGSMIYKLTWKQKATPQLWPYCQLVASTPHTKGIGYSMPRKGWTTPNARDWKDTAGQTTKREAGRTRIDQVPREAYQLIGTEPSIPDFGTENAAHYQLNPRFSLWLMGYPIEWAYCAEQVTLSSHKLAQK